MYIADRCYIGFVESAYLERIFNCSSDFDNPAQKAFLAVANDNIVISCILNASAMVTLLRERCWPFVFFAQAPLHQASLNHVLDVLRLSPEDLRRVFCLPMNQFGQMAFGTENQCLYYSYSQIAYFEDLDVIRSWDNPNGSRSR